MSPFWSNFVIVLSVLTLGKNAYMAGIGNYYTFYLIERFSVSVQDSQILLFVHLGEPEQAIAWLEKSAAQDHAPALDTRE